MAKKQKELSLETILYNCRDCLRNVGSFEKKRDALIGLAFLKFASDKFERRCSEIVAEYGNNPLFLNKIAFYNSKNVYYLEPHCRWNYIVKNSSSDDIAVKLDKAFKDIESKNISLKGTLPQNLFSSLGADAATLKSVVDEINKISEERFHEEDLIGRVYEYFLQIFAIGASKEDGEFYTPACVVKLISELIEPYDGVVYDPCCGSGGMFVQSMKFIEKHQGNRKKITIVGQEKQPETWRLAKMNLAIRGISCNLGEKSISTFTNDQHENVIANYIMANPPFNLKYWRGSKDYSKDPRFKSFLPALPPDSNANYAWIIHMLSKLDVDNGIAGFLLANGALKAGMGSEDDEDVGQDQYLIRKKIIEDDKVEAIIVLPRNMFYTTDISVTLWILNNNKKAKTLGKRKLRDRTNEVLFVDIRTWNQNVVEYKIDKKLKKKKVVLSDEQIEKVKQIYNNWQSVNCKNSKKYSKPELYRSVNLSEIKSKNFTLAPNKYIHFIDHDMNIDFNKEINSIKNKMKILIEEESESQKMLIDAFKGIGYDIKKN